MSGVIAQSSVRRRAFGLVVVAASVPMFMATLDNLVMTNALPVLHSQLGASVEELQWFGPDELPAEMAFPGQPVVLQRWVDSLAS